ncbi:MAG: hypothetical protein GF381_02210 [Candidatus Pacebacteria bacterium]|nr:hypothetical protein [Candidatus Paceibacterota bacterium]
MSSSNSPSNTKLANHSYLSPSLVVIGLTIMMLLTGLFIGINLIKQSQDPRSEARIETTINSPADNNPADLSGEQTNLSNDQTGIDGQTGSINTGPEKLACEQAGGQWKQFPDACADLCSALEAEGCATVITESCDCGPNECWHQYQTADGEKVYDCIPNSIPIEPPITQEPKPTDPPTTPSPKPTISQNPTYRFDSTSTSSLKIYRSPLPFDPNNPINQAFELKVMNLNGDIFTVEGTPNCNQIDGCFQQFQPNADPSSLNYWHKWKPVYELDQQPEALLDYSNHWDVEGSADPYDGSWVVRVGYCPELTADFNSDCQVNSADREFLLNRIWGSSQDDLQADIYGPNGQPDGQVNTWDYSLLVRQWTAD